ncbi:MAG: hypothetical protein AB1752_01170 [Candidatus Zixiibacteriota bacterium]
MTKFTYNDFRVLERCPSSPKNLQAGISHLVYCSVNTRAKVETCNPETGEYRIVLQGTLDMDNPFVSGSGAGF